MVLSKRSSLVTAGQSEAETAMQIQEDIPPMDIGLSSADDPLGAASIPENHDRSTVHPGDLFFAEPPAECGEITSGTTNVNRIEPTSSAWPIPGERHVS